MAHVNNVMQSIELDGGDRCVDVFLRPDDTFGFEEYRRDVEDGRGWFAIGAHAGRVFSSNAAAYRAARAAVPWLNDRGSAIS